MKISACYIVKNEEQNLSVSLDSIKNAVDEIIVVDTGSVDKTKEIASAYGAKIYDFFWQDDFSAPRNYAIEQAGGDWIVFLDADDYFVSPSMVRQAVEDIAHSHPDWDGVLLEYRNIDKSKGNRLIDIGWSMRLLRRDDSIRYRGRIHEGLYHQGGTLQIGYGDERLALYHTGYSADIIQDKLERDKRILELEAGETGWEPRHHFYLADIYYDLQEYQQALWHALCALDSDLFVAGGMLRLYQVALESMRRLNMDLKDMLALAERGIVMYPEAPDCYAQKGMILCGLQSSDEALKALQISLEKYHRYPANSKIKSCFDAIAAEIVRQRVELLEQEKKNTACRITACYIVKNEAENLRKSLMSVHQEVDEIVVIDTGSIDETIAVAESFGARIFAYPWQDDFAAARNTALAKAKGEWIVFLDADEYFTAATAENIRRVITKFKEKELLLVSMKNIDKDSGEEQLMFYAPRIFKKKKGRCYEGRIHEQLRDAGKLIEPVAAIPAAELQLIHTGYSASLTKEKAERNLVLLQQELQHAEHPEYLYMYLAETYDALGQEEEALEYARKDIETGRKVVTYASRSYRILLCRLAVRPEKRRERRKIAEQAVRDFPEVAEFHAEYAACLAADCEYLQAIREGKMALTVIQNCGIEPSMFDEEAAIMLQGQLNHWQKISQLAAELKISASVITKNEAENLPSWLENTEIFANERIVVDTGSIDATVKLAEHAGCIIQHHLWQDDFAAARNQALAVANGDWICVMDADETILEPTRVRYYLAWLSLTRPEINVITPTIFNVDRDDGNRLISESHMARFIRRSAKLQYQGKIHEQLVAPVGEKIQNINEPVHLQICHTGYSSKRIHMKLQRDYELLQQEIAQKGMQSYHYRYLADCCYGMGEYQRAADYASQAIQGEAFAAQAQSDMYRVLLACERELKINGEQQIRHCQEAKKHFPDLPDFYGLLGMLYYEQGNMEKAEQELQAAISRFKQRQAGGETTQIYDFLDTIYAYLATIQGENGRWSEAGENLEQALKINPRNETALDLYVERHQQEGVIGLLQALMKIAGQEEQDLRYLARFAMNYGWLDLHERIRLELEKSGIHMQSALLNWSREKVIPDMVRDMKFIAGIIPELQGKKEMDVQRLARKCREVLPPEWEATFGCIKEGAKKQ